MVQLTDFREVFQHEDLELPGFDVQRRMAPPFRGDFDLEFVKKQNPKPAAVLILLYQNSYGDIEFPIILRHIYDGVHSGQYGLPGGSFDEGDISLDTTALRETGEELGVDIDQIEILHHLTELYVPPSGFLIYPFVGIYHGEPDFVPDNYEVQALLPINLEAFLNAEPIAFVENDQQDIPGYQISEGEHIWGATAMILEEFKEIIWRAIED